MEIKHKVAILIGASHDIGREIERVLATKGATVIVIDNTREEVKDIIRKTLEQYWHIDILVTIIENGIDGAVEGMDIEKYKAVASQNAGDVLHPMQILIPIMRNRAGGAIVNVGIHASTGQVITGPSLAARAECAKDDIVVSVIRPKANHSEINVPAHVAKKVAQLIQSESAGAEV